MSSLLGADELEEWTLPGFVDTPWLGRRGASTMPKSHRPYPPELRQRSVELVRKGRSPEELAQQFETLGPGDPELGKAGAQVLHRPADP